MSFKVRAELKKQFDTVHQFKFNTLIVGGCSFVYNNSNTGAVTWPYYLRDLGGFQQVLDCSLPGAGNNHISDSLIWSLETECPDPETSLIIVMWSGNDRDDYIAPKTNITDYPFQFYYNNNVMSASTGGSHPSSNGNAIRGLKDLANTKTNESRAVENYLCIVKTYQYLKSHNYQFIFLNFLDSELPSRTNHFDIKPYLPPIAQNNLDSMLTSMTDLYSYAIKNDLLESDDFHPNPNGHLGWTKQVLLPYLQTKFG